MMTTIRKRFRERFFARINAMEAELAAVAKIEAMRERCFAELFPDTRKGDLAVNVYLTLLGALFVSCIYNLSR